MMGARGGEIVFVEPDADPHVEEVAEGRAGPGGPRDLGNPLRHRGLYGQHAAPGEDTREEPSTDFETDMRMCGVAASIPFP